MQALDASFRTTRSGRADLLTFIRQTHDRRLALVKFNIGQEYLLHAYFRVAEGKTTSEQSVDVPTSRLLHMRMINRSRTASKCYALQLFETAQASHCCSKFLDMGGTVSLVGRLVSLLYGKALLDSLSSPDARLQCRSQAWILANFQVCRVGTSKSKGAEPASAFTDLRKAEKTSKGIRGPLSSSEVQHA